MNSVRKLYQLAEKKFTLLRDNKKTPWMFLVCLKQDLDLFKMDQYNTKMVLHSTRDNSL